MSNYSKYKERMPQDTIFEIRRILNEMGLFPVQTWTNSAYEGAKSCRVSIYPTKLGSNGKGTDVLYSTASGFAELMERMNNGLLTVRDRRDSFYSETGFHDFPDEKVLSIEEIVAHPDPYTLNIFIEMGCIDRESQAGLLGHFAECYGKGTDSLPCVPFADPGEDKIWYVPIDFVFHFAGSNGMAAGNTLEEAMVQGMSEIFERAASAVLLKGQAVPPKIPEEEIKHYSFYRLLKEAEKDGRYRVTLYDLSMGRDWPVTGLCVSDLSTGQFGFKLGAHPSFAVSVERTLTEALQGKNMEFFANSCRIGSLEDSSSYDNIPNVSKTGEGTYPYTMFCGKTDWEYKKWTAWEGLDNRGFLKGMLQILKKEGYHPIFRDVSFLGFPSCFIVVPGFSESFPRERLAYRVMNSYIKVLASFDTFPDVTAEEEKRILQYIRFREYSILENQISFITCRQLSSVYDARRIAAFIALKHEKYDAASHFFHGLVKGSSGAEKDYYSAICRYADLRQMGADHTKATDIIRGFHPYDIAEEVCEDTDHMERILQRKFSRMNCYDCKNCLIAGTDCDYPACREVFLKITKAMKKENVSQEQLLLQLKEMYADM